MINHLTPAEIREAIQDIASRVNDPALKANYVHWGKEGVTYNEEAQDDLVFLLDLLDAMSEECFELTPAAKQLLDGEQ